MKKQITAIIRTGEVDKNFEIIAPGAIDTAFPTMTISEEAARLILEHRPPWSIEVAGEIFPRSEIMEEAVQQIAEGFRVPTEYFQVDSPLIEGTSKSSNTSN